jgi:hypothetical protein
LPFDYALEQTFNTPYKTQEIIIPFIIFYWKIHFFKNGLDQAAAKIAAKNAKGREER